MDTYKLINDAYLLIAAYKGIDYAIWNAVGVTREGKAVRRYWLEQGWMIDAGNVGFELTSVGKELVNAYKLIGYETGMLAQHISYSELPPDAQEAGYAILRGGLAAYFHGHIKETFLDAILPVVDYELPDLTHSTGVRVLDLGAGSGAYGLAVKEKRPVEVNLTLADRKEVTSALFAAVAADSIAVTIASADFEEDPVWYGKFPFCASFDVIILAEVLHCKNVSTRTKLLLACRSILRQGGKLLVVEQNRNPRLNWRMALCSTGDDIGPDQLIHEVTQHGFTEPAQVTENPNESHYICVFPVETP